LETLLPTQMFPHLPARATFLADTNFVSGKQKMFLILFRNILCPQQMFLSLRSLRNITINNVSSFARALTSLNMRHHANLRRDFRELLHFTCVNLHCPFFSHFIIAKKHTFAQYLFLFSIGHTKMRFEPVKLRNFHRFYRGLKGLFVDG